MQDGQLLRQYVEAGSEAAFSQIVKRHMNLVYAVCRREIEDAALAEDVTQVVFLLLARKAPALRREATLAGWLFQTARFACKNAKRQEQRRRQREQKIAEEMGQDLQPDNAVWNDLEPFVNQALAALNPTERDAVLLRVLEGCSLAETGASLGLSEEAARKRVARALEKVRRHLAKQGVVATSAARFHSHARNFESHVDHESKHRRDRVRRHPGRHRPGSLRLPSAPTSPAPTPHRCHHVPPGGHFARTCPAASQDRRRASSDFAQPNPVQTNCAARSAQAASGGQTSPFATACCPA
ncbi:MAG: sigma-70 family RNA polymerase sigma factor, partial [Armatimonadota bacterium]|nr:sigma-70 family RNA polymerase sigma factor [Armatimonadota bacterium]